MSHTPPKSQKVKPKHSSRILGSTLSAALDALTLPIPGRSEIQEAIGSLLDDIKVQGFNDRQSALISRRIERLMQLLNRFEELECSEMSRRLHEIKERLEEECGYRTRLGMSDVERRQYLLDELNAELSMLIEETQLQLACSRSVSRRSNPLDNFLNVQPRELAQCKLFRQLTEENHPQLGWRNSDLDSNTGKLVTSSYYSRHLNLPVIYTTYHTPRDNRKACEAAEDELEYLDGFMHENIARVIGVTQGYHGINGIIVEAGRLTLKHFLSYVDSGPVLARCLRGLLEATRKVIVGNMFNDWVQGENYLSMTSEITVEPNGHALIYLSESNGYRPVTIFLSDITEYSDTVIHPTVKLIIKVAKNNLRTPVRLLGFLDSIASLGWMQFSETSVARLAAEHNMVPNGYTTHEFITNTPPPFTVCPGDIGYLVAPIVQHPESPEEDLYQWVVVSQAPVKWDIVEYCSGWERTLRNEWHSYVASEPYGICYSGLSPNSSYDERTIIERLSSINETDPTMLYYCRSWTYIVYFRDLQSTKRPDQLFYFHYNPYSRSKPRDFWGFLSTSSDPNDGPTGVEELGIHVEYKVTYYTYPITALWSYQYERMVQSNLISIPGGYPDSHIEEI